MQIQIQIQNKYKWSNQIEPLTRTIPSENKHSADQIHSSSQILNSPFWLWVNNVWFRINNGRLFSKRNTVERLQGAGGHTKAYTWVLDIFHLEKILLAAVVNMTHWGGFAMDTVLPHLPPSQQGWWKDINQLTLVSLVNSFLPNNAASVSFLGFFLATTDGAAVS